MKSKFGKPFRTPEGPKKFSVYVKNEKGNTVKVNFGDPDAEIKRDDPEKRKSFRKRHGCENPGPRWKPKYWSCKMWSKKPVSKITKESKTIEPTWAKDEEIWSKAKRAASKSDAADKWALTTYLYKKMGGEIAPKKEAATGKDAQPGVQVTHWFWGTEAFLKGDPKRSQEKPATSPAAKELPKEKTADEQAQELLIQAPDMPAATMLNALKSKGVKLVNEADSATGNTAVLRSQESAGFNVTSSENVTFSARFMESSYRDNGIGPVKFKVALIQEGLGNLRDAYYYTREALETGIQAFEGKKCFADHPSRSEETDRPERSVRDIVGHFENVRLEEASDGAAVLCADLIMLPDPAFAWARGLVRQALEYSKKYPTQEFIGLSINASGEAKAQDIATFLAEAKLPQSAKPKLQSAMAEGVQTVKVVSAIRDAVSTDLVTEPGARGKVLELLESERANEMKKAKQAEAKQAEAEMEKKPEMKQEEVKHAEAIPAEQPEGEEDHEDVEKDKALILDMIKKHMGESAEGMEGEGEMAAHEAYEAYKEMGKSHEEALKCAAEAMKLAKHMAAKQEAKAAESEVEAEESEEVESEEAKHSESAVVKLTARVAFLERELKKHELTKALDKKLAESKLGRAETDKLRKLIGEPKSEAHIELTIKTFKEGFAAAGGGESTKPTFSSLFVTSAEKATETKEKAKVSFTDLIQK